MVDAAGAARSARQGVTGRRLAKTVAAIICSAAVICSSASGRTSRAQNLLQNSAAGVGAISAQGWDSVTIPG
jgi:hypothetical protein